MNHDPMIANADAQTLVHIVDCDPNASQREKRLAEYLRLALEGQQIRGVILGRTPR